MTPPNDRRPPRPFEPWAIMLADDLRPDPDHPRHEGPGSLSEAVALLVSPRLLGPQPPDGLPGLYAHGGDPSAEALGLALYSAAFGPELSDPDPAFRVYAAVDHEQGTEPALEAAGVVVGTAKGQKDVLVFSEPGLPLPEISCSNLADLRRLHTRVLSAALRV